MVTDRPTTSKARTGRAVWDDGRVSPTEPEPMLRCRACSTPAPADGPQYCALCFGPVEVVLPDVADGGEVRARVASGPPTMARYAPLLPPGLRIGEVSAGWTPLRPAPGLGEALGLADLWVKDETANPTGSFKDRVVDLALARAAAVGSTVAACTSTGNLARALAVGAARRGMEAVVLVPDVLAPVEVERLVSLGAHVVAVRGGYDAASRLGADVASDLDGWAWVNVGLRPWYEIGARTSAWEIAEQLGWTAPAAVVAPMASGALARALHEGFAHLAAQGLLAADAALPALHAVEPAGCAPAAAAFAAGPGTPVRPVRPDTRVESLAMGDPPDADAVIDAARGTGGSVTAVDEADVPLAVERLHATEGLAGEPAVGVVVAALGELATRHRLGPDERIVAVVTGASDPRVPAGLVLPRGTTATIDPTIGAVLAALPSHVTRA